MSTKVFRNVREILKVSTRAGKPYELSKKIFLKSANYEAYYDVNAGINIYKLVVHKAFYRHSLFNISD